MTHHHPPLRLDLSALVIVLGGMSAVGLVAWTCWVLIRGGAG